MYYVLVSIGCLYCHNASDLLGVFTSEEVAEEAAEQHKKVYMPNFSTDYDLKIFCVGETDVLYAPRYKDYDTVYDLGQDAGFKYTIPSTD